MFTEFLNVVLNKDSSKINAYIKLYNKDIKNNNNDTILHYICNYNINIDIIKFWLSFDPNCKLKNNNGLYALDIARNNGRKDIVELLLPYTYKICLLISGMLRHFEITYKTYMKHFPNADIFIFTSENDILKSNYDLGGYYKYRTITKDYISSYLPNAIISCYI